MSVSELELQDEETIELGSITLKKHSNLFKLEPLSLFPYEKKDNVWVSVTIERNLGLSVLSRTLYTGFDFVSDVGGLSGFLLGFLAMIVGAWNHNSFDNRMVSHLYRIRHDKIPKKNTSIKVSRWPQCKDLLFSKFPLRCSKFKCCEKSRYDKALEDARNSLGQEIQIYHIIRKLRYFNQAISELLPE